MTSSKNCFFVFALLLVILLGGLFSHHARANTSSFKINPSGMTGSAGAGVAYFSVRRPSSDFRLDQGVYAALQGERGLGFLHLYLNLSLGYLSTTGLTAYRYSTLSGATYSGSDVAFTSQVFQGGLGLKFKLLQASFFRPYVEAGGIAGYYQIAYTNMAAKVSGPSTDAKDHDAILDFGTYYEGGLEISFAPTFGLRAAARFIEEKTKPVVTLNNQTIEYRSEIYYLSLLKNF